MAHLALYREFRPQRFADVVGQQHITRTIRNALIHKRLHHAYLLSGPRGTGKTTVARIMAKAVNCLNPQDGEPCNECSACQSILNGETMDVIEIDAASNRGIDEIRDLREKVKYAPADLKYKVYIIDEVHMLSEAAFNALLKTLEEPPEHVIFILATTEKHKLPVTIISRCQSFEYHRLSSAEIISRLRDVCARYNVLMTDDALAAIARQAEGGMRDALSLLDQVMAYAEGSKITLDDTLHVLGSAPLEDFLKLDQHLTKGDVGGALELLDELIRQGKDVRQLVRDYLAHMRDLLLVKLDSRGQALDLPEQSLAKLKQQSDQMAQEHILAAIRLFAQVENDLRFTSSPRLIVEVGLIRLAGIYSGQVAAEPAAEPAPAPPAAARKTAAPSQSAAPAPSRSRTHEEKPPEATQTQTQPSAPEAPPAPSGEGVEQVVQAWDNLLDLVRRARPSTHMLLSQARVGRLRGRHLILVAPNVAFAELLNRKADKEIVEKALARIGLTDLTVQAVGPDDPLGRPDPAQAAPAAAPEPETQERTLLDVARSVFPKDLVYEIKEEGSK